MAWNGQTQFPKRKTPQWFMAWDGVCAVGIGLMPEKNRLMTSCKSCAQNSNKMPGQRTVRELAWPFGGI